jgi:hypothetical protein
MLGVALVANDSRIRTGHFARPIRFPGAIVVRKSLLPTNMIAIDLRLDDTGFYRLTVVDVLAKKFALCTVKAADHPRIQIGRSCC